MKKEETSMLIDLGGRQGKVGGKVVDKQEVGSSFVAGFVAA